jgi:hypothetical protein
MRHEPIEEFECSFCGWTGDENCLIEPSCERCPSCLQNGLHEPEDADEVNAILGKQNAVTEAVGISLALFIGVVFGLLALVSENDLTW